MERVEIEKAKEGAKCAMDGCVKKVVFGLDKGSRCIFSCQEHINQIRQPGDYLVCFLATPGPDQNFGHPHV